MIEQFAAYILWLDDYGEEEEVQSILVGQGRHRAKRQISLCPRTLTFLVAPCTNPPANKKTPSNYITTVFSQRIDS